jgi:hypothetical protein
MSIDQAAVTAEAADRDLLAGIQIVEVPRLWPPLDPAAAAAAFPAPEPAVLGGVRAPEDPWPRQFAVLLAEAATGARPVQQVLPWLSKRGRVQLHRLLPVLRAQHRPRVLRVLTTAPSPDVIEMTMVVLVGTRARALAARLERTSEDSPGSRRGKLAARWLCTDFEAG